MLFILIFIFFFQEQNITIYVSDYNAPFQKYEKEMISKIIQLYNRQNRTIQIKGNFVEVGIFSKFLTNIANVRDDNEISIGGITITDERKNNFDFSAYFPVREVIYTKKNLDSTALTFKNLNLGYQETTVHETMIPKLKIIFPNLNYVSVKNSLDLLDDKKIDMFISDYANFFNYDENTIKIVKILNNFPMMQYGILFQKNSKLKFKLDPFIKYFIKSKENYSLIKLYLGNYAATYLQMNHLKN